jgi:hypothetical protein
MVVFHVTSFAKNALYVVQLLELIISTAALAVCTGTIVVLFKSIQIQSHFVMTYLHEYDDGSALA